MRLDHEGVSLILLRTMRRSNIAQVAHADHPRSTTSWVLIWALGTVLPGFGLAQEPLEQELRSTLSACPHAETSVGAFVVDLSDGQVVFAENPDHSLVPASALKVFTMSVALVELGPDFAFETLLATDGQHLYVIGAGDPAFGDERLHGESGEGITADFERWAAVLLERGMTVISGDLVIDESVFDGNWVHRSWEDDDLDNWYAAPVGGLNFNDNCVDITVSPSETAGALAIITVQPETSLVQIVNKCRSGGNGKPILHHAHDTFEYAISGRCNKRWPFGSVSFPDPGLLFADSLRTVLKSNGITICGTMRRERQRLADGTVSGHLTVLGRRTTPLIEVLRRAGKNSQNLFAECLLKRSGYDWARRQGIVNPQGSWKLGQQAVKELVTRAGVDTEGLVIADGSGLSRENTCTARQLVQLLAWAHRQTFASLLVDNLSVAGVDGSLRKRLADMPGRVHAKTGTMKGVRSLAGYVDGDAGPRYAFAVIFNGYNGPSTRYKEIQDRFCRILVATANRD